MPARIVLGALAFAIVAAGCGSDERVADPPAGIEFDVDAELVVDADGFTPPRLEIDDGDVVELRNEGNEVHRLTSDSIDSGLVEPGETVTLRFDEVGTVAYHDAEAPGHEGTVVVAPAG